MSLAYDLKIETKQHQKKWVNKGKKVLLIKCFVVDKKKKKLMQKAVNNVVFEGSLKNHIEYIQM